MDVTEEIKKLYEEIETLGDTHALEEMRLKIFGKKGFLQAKFSSLHSLLGEAKIALSKELNVAKREFEIKLINAKFRIDKELTLAKIKKERLDPSLFKSTSMQSRAHPISSTLDKIINYFISMNFSLVSGPLIEDDFYNFEALNIPKYHPARAMQDTFYFNDGMLLRTHTSPMQIRSLEQYKLRLDAAKQARGTNAIHPPLPSLRIISPGAVFRRDYDATHSPMFHQVEGLAVSPKENNISFANLKFILEDFLHYFFGSDIGVRFRSSFFPFTEPSAEVDIVWNRGNGNEYLEVLGCGMVDENVFSSVGLEDVCGYAFGMGVERFAMLLHEVHDLRGFFEGNLRFLEQFK